MEHLLFSEDHEWLDPATGAVGITAFAAEALGDIVYVQLPDAGSVITAGDSCGEIESTKSVSELYAPVGGVVAAVNAEVVADPGLINSDPYGRGWLYRVTLGETPADLLSAAAYAEITS